MGYIEERRKRTGEAVFKAQVRLKGHECVTQTFTRRSDAKQWIQRTEASMREGEFLPINEAKRHTLAETIDRFIAERLSDRRENAQAIAKLQWFRREIGFKRLCDITPAIIAECRQKLKSEKVRGKYRSGPTTNRFCSQLSGIFEYAKDSLYWCKRNPVREVKREKEHDGVVRFLDDDEKARLISACQKDEEPLMLPIVVLALSTGMRKEELRGLMWHDVDLNKGWILLPRHRTKNRTDRRIPLRGKALTLMRSLKESQQQGKLVRLHSFVFPNAAGDKPFDMRASWERVREQAALRDFRFHDLRHSCASYLAMNGASLLEIAEILGHKTLAMVKRYSHLSESHTACVLERMNSQLFAETNNEVART